MLLAPSFTFESVGQSPQAPRHPRRLQRRHATRSLTAQSTAKLPPPRSRHAVLCRKKLVALEDRNRLHTSVVRSVLQLFHSVRRSRLCPPQTPTTVTCHCSVSVLDNSTSASWPKSNWPKSELAEVEIGRSRNWPKSKLAEVEINWPKSNRRCLLCFFFSLSCFFFCFVFFSLLFSCSYSSLSSFCFCSVSVFVPKNLN